MRSRTSQAERLNATLAEQQQGPLYALWRQLLPWYMPSIVIFFVKKYRDRTLVSDQKLLDAMTEAAENARHRVGWQLTVWRDAA